MQAIINKYGFKEGLTTRAGKITNWPYAEKKPTIAELAVIVSEYTSATSYADERVLDYPPIQDQLDMIYKDGTNRTNKWAEMITAIKLNHPKPE
jgi:hypothetical protein